MKKTLFIISFILVLGCKDSQDPKVSKILNNLENLVDLKGEPFDVSTLEGKKVLVNYWATWCAPCKKEMPDLLAAQKILSKENYVFLLISDESKEQIQDFKNKFKYDFTFLRSSESLSNIGIYAMPTTFVFNEKGKKVKEIIGATEWNSEEMITQLKEL
ncbi:Thiol-disulfide oxidoreductase ResA [Polaribacter huanghezhanensis]|uniref:TlpA family protein disulfide reductase n=1 Tax=Polaribacter huanghezhanensis TaxID=1354726 RepID=UPI00264973E1|nr:TlpA disulfide reductase family protein [Polaribacter huanghezhanensis]WKD86926.1 Thiol-disulfide oxidoreductase ResA [Polaribacter huanghezhanensis]